METEARTVIAKPKKKPAARQKEGSLSDAIRDRLALEPGLILWRNSSGAVRKGGRVYRAGLGNGTADLIGTLAIEVLLRGELAEGRIKKIGRFVALEIKSPGEIPSVARVSRARAREPNEVSADDRRVIEQEDFADRVRVVGGFACYVDSVEGAVAAIARARRGAVE